MAQRTAQLDRLDRRILNVLQRDCRITNADLAEAVGTSPPSSMRRVRRLRQQGFIEREIAVIDPKRSGDSLIAISEVRLNNHNSQARDRAIRNITAIPEVNQCYNVTGDRDLLVISYLTDIEDFEVKITEPLSSMKEIQSVNSYFVIKRIKFEPFVHFDETST